MTEMVTGMKSNAETKKREQVIDSATGEPKRISVSAGAREVVKGRPDVPTVAKGVEQVALSAHSGGGISKIPLFPPDRPNGRRIGPPPTAPLLLRMLQPKLVVGAVDDTLEHEADHVADQVMRMPDRQPSRSAAPRPVSRKLGSSEKEEVQTLQAKTLATSTDADSEVPGIVHEVLRMPGQPLDAATRRFIEPRLGHDFSRVRIHADAIAAQSAGSVHALAYTAGRHIVFGSGQYAPGTVGGRRLLAHELTHVVQQDGPTAPASAIGRARDFSTTNEEPPQQMERAESAGLPHAEAPVLRRAPAQVARQETTVDVGLITSLDQYQPAGSREIYRVGDTAATRLLMDIEDRSGQIVLRSFNFETGAAEEMSVAQWSFLRGAAIIGGSNAGITQLGQQLSAAKWRSLWPDPLPELLRLFEAGQLTLSDEAVLTGYHGLIRTDADRALAENEQAIDKVLAAPDRVTQIKDYASGLREASVVRDAMVQRRDELSRRLAAQHSFTFGLPHAGTGPDVAQQLNIHRERGAVDDALTVWLAAFPLLTRLQTSDIAAATVEAKLREIKSNIVTTRQQLDRGRVDPMTLDTVRARIAGKLGPRATAVVEAEDRARSHRAIAGGIALAAGSVALLFLPGGVFIDVAVGTAIAAQSIATALEVGRAANTGLHVNDGLVSQAQAQNERFAAVLATVFAVVGAAAAGFRVLRVGLALRGLGRSLPHLALAERAAVARAIADDPALISAFSKVAPEDVAIGQRVATAARAAGGDVRALRTALGDVARIAAIPRRVPAGPDLYEPLRAITDGSDIERVAAQTGLPRAEVEAAKRNLMLDEHILVDDTGAVYRSRFEPFKDVADLWARAGHGQALADADRSFLRRLVKHEFAEGRILGSDGRTLEEAFLRGGLEGKLRAFLQSRGWNVTKIEQLLAHEPKPVTPYRFAHLVAALSGAPNP